MSSATVDLVHCPTPAPLCTARACRPPRQAFFFFLLALQTLTLVLHHKLMYVAAVLPMKALPNPTLPEPLAFTLAVAGSEKTLAAMNRHDRGLCQQVSKSVFSVYRINCCIIDAGMPQLFLCSSLCILQNIIIMILGNAVTWRVNLSFYFIR